MKIHRVKIENLNSIYGAQQVDFDRFQSPLFLIVGPTGAGKTTVLDAISLALFGTTPRLKKISGGSTPDCVSRGTTRAGATVDFSSAKPGSVRRYFRATWFVEQKRSGGKFSKPTRALHETDSAGEILETLVESDTLKYVRPAFNAVLDNLTDEEFQRSILLAQNKFADFLFAEKSERAAILERLSRTDQFRRIGSTARDIASAKSRVVEEFRAQLGVLSIPVEADLAAMRATGEQIETELIAANNALEVIDFCVTWHATTSRLERDITAATERVEAARVHRAALDEVAQKLKKSEDFRLLAQHCADVENRSSTVARIELELGRLTESSRVAEERVAQRQASFLAHQEQRLARENEYRAILPQVEAAGRILDRIDAADTLLGESTELIRRTDSTTRMIEHAQLKLAQQQARLAAAQDSLVAAEQLSAQCSGSLAKFCEPSQPEDFAAQCEKSLRELQLQASSLQLLHAAFIEFRAKSAELKERQVSRQNAELEAARSAEICQRLETERSAALLALTVSRQAGRALQFAVDLVAHRDLLVAGDPCPLCGSTHHDKENQLDVRSQQESLRQHESHLAALEQSLATLEKSMRAQDQAAATARERIRSLTEHEASLARRLEEIVAQFPPGTDVTQPDGGVAEVAAKLQVLAEQERELADRIKQARDLAREAQRADQSVQQLKLEAIGVQNSAEQTTIEIRSLQREFADRQEALQELATKQQSAQEAVASACLAAGIGVAGVAEIPEFRRCVLAQFGGKSPASVRAERESAAQAASELAEKARQLEQTARISAAEAAQSLRDATQHHATELSALSSAADALDSNLLQAGFANAAALIASIFSADDERAALLQLADADSLLARELGSLLESQNTLDAHRAGASALGNEEATASAESAQHLQSEAIALRSQILERRGELREKLAGAESLIARASSVREKLEAAVADSAVWEKLSGLIGKREGAAFQEFAQSVTLRELIGLANPRLERIAPRYALTSTGSEEEDSWDLEFQIVDRGQGDGVRSISTLSGGETFLVSLALALALADLRKSTLPIETLLLDEGFGSLDSDTLDVALDAIQQLSADGGTQIGIVSHVDSLRERISDQVIVEPRGGGRSTLRTLTVSG